MTGYERDYYVAVGRIAKALEKPKEIDWEQRRYEIAKELYTRLLTHPDGNVRSFSFRERQGHAKECIYMADILIEELQKPKQ